MASLDELIAQQQQTMGTVTRALANFKKLGQAKMTLAVTRHRLDALEKAFEKCQDLDAQLIAKCPSKNRNTIPYFTGEQFGACEDAYYEASDFMTEVIATWEEESARQKSPAQPVEPVRTSAHLPQLRLPTFDGDLKQWESFKARFDSLVSRDRNLTDTDKLHYLLSCLTGEASNSLAHLALTDANFKIAWQILVDRYDNKRLLVTAHLDALHSLPTVGETEVLNGLRDLRDRSKAAVLALENLERPVRHWDDILVYLISRRLDCSTRQSWELTLGDTTDYPTYQQLHQFLASRIRALEAISHPSQSANRRSSGHTPSKIIKPRNVSAHATAFSNPCPVCKSAHLIYQCDMFRNKTPNERYNVIKNLKRCLNCFSAKHSVQECGSDRSCKQCQRRHHTMLHFPGTASSPPATNPHEQAETAVTEQVNIHSVTRAPAQILLATARVRIHSPLGHFVYARALLDQGSAATVVTERLVQLLKLPRSNTSLRITGVGATETSVRHTVNICVSPHFDSQPSYSAVALVLKTLTRYIPCRNQLPLPSHIRELRLADSDPTSSEPIDIIIGADLFGSLLLDGVRRGRPNEPVAQRTVLGWILSGPMFLRPTPSTTITITSTPIHHASTLVQLDTNLRKFWEIEGIADSLPLSSDEQQCEAHFANTHTRDASGRYQVRLPFKHGPPLNLGNSRTTAEARFFQLERRLAHQTEHLTLYRDFMTEYLRLNHMELVPKNEIATHDNYYIPHHAVFKSSTTTPLRVVFNASSRAASGKSLNDHLHIGPKLQGDLPSLLLRWRQFRYAFTTDIAKMYRQILVHSHDRDYQRILWRDSPADPISEYRLSTVTYGTASAAFQAQRVLRQLVTDEGDAFPLAGPALLEQTYVDDILFGADDLPLALATRDQLMALLQKGGFQLRKWASNCPQLLVDIDSTNHGLAFDKPLHRDDFLSVLGLNWYPTSDLFQFRVELPSVCGNSKRAILSVIARLFDPLGFLAPVIITAKILLQKLWASRCDWDEVVPSPLLQIWQEYFASLSLLNNVSIPRWIYFSSDSLQFSLHGFADASRDAYAAVVYSRISSLDGSVSISLLAAKSRVAPLKTLSIPRLELCAALLLTRLLEMVISSLPRLNAQCYCWSDSTIVLAWLRQTPAQWQTFVANRVSKIQTALPHAVWRHVPTYDNPADCASRGISAEEFLNRELWWGGPLWLKSPPSMWPAQPAPPSSTNIPESRGDTAIHTISAVENCSWLERFSSWKKLLRVTAYIFKFISVTRKQEPHSESSNHSYLQSEHIRKSKFYLLRAIQSCLFPTTIQHLRLQQPLSRADPLLSLNPFLDEHGLLRVGGRLANSALPFRVRHPVILASHPTVALIIRDYHIRALHGGHSLTISSLREEFWLLRARTTVRSVLRSCVTCARETPRTPTELMGQLPPMRVNAQSRAFVHTGVDYAGPIMVRSSSLRGHRSHKAYVALFVCMSTKAVHIELVHSYGSDAFIAAFQRFSSRRGVPNSLYSDNGTTFQGADRELSRSYQLAIRDPNFLSTLVTDAVQWHFLPPSAPHFGGLWEAGVKRLKYHLKRCTGGHTLTIEEMTTLLCRIESCLNSRPLAPLSDCVTDLHALTPGHFLIGAPLLSIPEPSVLDLKEGRLSRWQLVQRLSEQFWGRWKQEYLHTLQQRPKWRTIQNLARIGRLVLLRDDNSPPCKWALGRIIHCHPGTDGLVRVVTVKTAHSTFKRPIAKIVFLPVDINTADECALAPRSS